jgi:hypothetical protein
MRKPVCRIVTHNGVPESFDEGFVLHSELGDCFAISAVEMAVTVPAIRAEVNDVLPFQPSCILYHSRSKNTIHLPSRLSPLIIWLRFVCPFPTP